MAKTFRKIQQWDKWLEHFPGNNILETERKYLEVLLPEFHGNQALMLGTLHQEELLHSSPIRNKYLLTPFISRHKKNNLQIIESDLHELPIASGSVDLVILSHILEHIDNPHRLFTEACRIIKPQGHIIIFGFNPKSLWGLKKSYAREETIPWSGNFIKCGLIKKWLQIADFELIKQKTMLFRPYTTNKTFHKNLAFLEWLGSKIYLPFGGIYSLVGQAKVIPLTPIKLSWKQKISDVRISSIGIPKPIVRNQPQ